MSLRAAILGFLSLEPTSGYSLQQRFDGSIGGFWTATQSQIYRELHALEADGQVTVRVEPGDGKPARKMYATTKAGREQLERWLKQPLEPLQLRHPLLLKLVLAAELPAPELDAVLASYEQGLLATRDEYRSRFDAERIFSLARSRREVELWRLSLEHGVAWVQTELSWVRKARKRLSQRDVAATKSKEEVSVELKGKVVLVTGASSGIGLAIAHALCAHGARVAFAARSLAILQQEVARARAAGGEALAVQLDVTSEASVAGAVDAVLAHYGRADVLVNNAGNGGVLSLWSASDSRTTREMFDVHVLGSERMMRAVLPAMRAQGGGLMVNFASTVAWVPMPGAAAYSSAKAAVVALSETLRAELRDQGIDVRVFAPPHTKTQAGQAWPLGLPKIFEPEWVAEQFIQSLRGSRARSLPGGNGILLFLQRLSPALAARIMHGIGFKAVARAAA